MFPGYETDPYSGVVKYGRSYSGEFSRLSPFVFIMVSKALRELGIEDAEYVPVSVSYERVPVPAKSVSPPVMSAGSQSKTRETRQSSSRSHSSPIRSPSAH